MKIATQALVPWLMGVAVLSLTIGFGPVLRGKGKSQNPDLTLRDIALGTPFKLPPKDIFGRAIDPEATTLLVFAGACSGCSLNAIPPSKLYSAQFDQRILLYQSSERQLSETFAKPDSKVLMLADSEGKLVAALGAQSSPRFYIIERENVKAIWKDTLTWPKDWIPEVRK